MKHLLPFCLLVIPSLCVDAGDTATRTCDGTRTPYTLVNDGTDCMCKCDTTEKCITWTQLLDSSPIQEAYALLCGANNAALRSAVECSDPSFLVFDTAATECTCPTCDETTKCDWINLQDARCSHGSCVKPTCVPTADASGNTLAVVTYQNSTNCTETCTRTGTGTDHTGTVCWPGNFEMDADLCWSECVTVDGVNTLVPVEDINEFTSDSHALYSLKKACMARNTELQSANMGAIVPQPLSQDNPGCGCARVEEMCWKDGSYYRLDGEQCIEYKCEVVDKPVSVSDTETYANKRITDVSTAVDAALCEERQQTRTHSYTTTDTRVTRSDLSTDDTICSSDTKCDDSTSDWLVCITITEGEDTRTFTTCALEYWCLLKDGTDVTAVKGRCPSDAVTEDECVLGTVRISDDKVSGSRCPLICECLNIDGRDYNVERCAPIEGYGFNILKEACPNEIGADGCTLRTVAYEYCPLSTDDDLGCSKFTCDPLRDLNDVSDGGICRFSTIYFQDAQITPRDETIGCTLCECDREVNTLVCKRYDEDTVTSKGILEVCPELEGCANVDRYELHGVCGRCPTCGADNDCDDEMVRSGDNACRQDPLNDVTREEGEAVIGRVRVSISVRTCADRFSERTRSEIYDMINQAALLLVEEECADIDRRWLKSSVVEFELIFAEPTNDEVDCDRIAGVKAVLHFSDTEEQRLRDLLECLKAVDDITGIQVRIRTALQHVTRDTRVEEDEQTGEATTNADGDYFYAESGTASDLGLMNAEGTELLTLDEPSTTGEGGETTDARRPGESGAAEWSLVVAIMGSLVVLLF